MKDLTENIVEMIEAYHKEILSSWSIERGLEKYGLLIENLGKYNDVALAFAQEALLDAEEAAEEQALTTYYLRKGEGGEEDTGNEELEGGL